MSHEIAEVSSAADLIQQTARPRGYPIQHQHSLGEVVSRKWLPRLQLLTTASDKVKTGELSKGYYILYSATKVEFLGESVNIWPITFRRKALDCSNKAKPIAVYELGAEFDDIRHRANDVHDSGCMWGPEFLVWVPAAQRIKFATFFMASASARNEAPNFDSILAEQGFATLGMQVLKNTRYTWIAPEIRPYSGELVLPTEAELEPVLESFNNPPKGAVLEADDEKSSREV